MQGLGLLLKFLPEGVGTLPGFLCLPPQDADDIIPQCQHFPGMAIFRGLALIKAIGHQGMADLVMDADLCPEDLILSGDQIDLLVKFMQSFI